MEDLTRIQALASRAHQDKEYRPVAAGLITDQQGRVLFVQSAKNTDDWGFPQGGVEPGEEVVDALLREINEEVGILPRELHVDAFLHTEDLDAPPERTSRRGFTKGKRYFFFALTYHGDGNLTCDPKEIHSCQWVSPLNIAATLATTRAKRRVLIEKVLQKFFVL